MENQQRTVVIPAHPQSACYYFDQDENTLTIRTNFWMFGRCVVSAVFLSFSISICFACYQKLMILLELPGVWDYIWFTLTFLFGVYLLCVTAKMLFERIHIELNTDGIQYRYRLLFYSTRKRIPLNNIHEFQSFTKPYDKKHTEYFVKAMTDEDELLIFCDDGVNQEWLEAELNYMLAYLREKEKGGNLPPFRKTCIIDNVKYRFRSKNTNKQ